MTWPVIGSSQPGYIQRLGWCTVRLLGVFALKGVMSRKILHILSQRPSRTGSGVTLEAMVREAARAGWEQAAVIGAPTGDRDLAVGDLATNGDLVANGGLAANRIYPVWFANGIAPPHGASQITQYPDLDLPIPGMSDVMPYPSTVWSTMTLEQLDQYRTVWRCHLARVIDEFSPDVIHSHHIWLVSSLVKDVAPEIPIVTTCHSTGLRQMILTPHLASEVTKGCARNERFCVLRSDHRQALQEALGIDPERIHVVGAGYRADLFRQMSNASADLRNILYVGKLSRAKGLPWLLEVFANLRQKSPELKLHIAGSGSGSEAEKIRQRISSLAPQVILHGPLAQDRLATLMRQCAVCVLPSFYEGVPLVLVEAAACGCQIVTTDLPGVREQIAPHLGHVMDLVPLPRLHGVDQPVAEDLPAFVENLQAAILSAQKRAAAQQVLKVSDLTSFTWEMVFERVQKVWLELLAR